MLRNPAVPCTMIVKGVPVRLASALIALTLAAMAPDAASNIVDTKHNLAPLSPPAAPQAGASGLRRVSSHAEDAGARHAASEAASICAFCHTPFGEPGAVPTWQSSPTDGQTPFATYASVGSTSRESATELGSVSIACLSCHDGTQAVSVTGYPMLPRSPHQLNDEGIPVDRVATQAPPVVSLSASHPVGVRYSGDAPGASRLMRVSPEEGLVPVREIRLGFRTAERALINGVPVWWIETGAPGRQREDIHLFSRVTSDGATEPYVECSSCHDPHSGSRMFLRHPEPEGFICGTCHLL